MTKEIYKVTVSVIGSGIDYYEYYDEPDSARDIFELLVKLFGAKRSDLYKAFSDKVNIDLTYETVYSKGGEILIPLLSEKFREAYMDMLNVSASS